LKTLLHHINFQFQFPMLMREKMYMHRETKSS